MLGAESRELHTEKLTKKWLSKSPKTFARPYIYLISVQCSCSCQYISKTSDIHCVGVGEEVIAKFSSLFLFLEVNE